MTEETKVKDRSNEHLYFTVTPRLVWALCEDPDEYTFWCVVKDIAGEDGECILAREDLAALAMISAGKASLCRESLIRKKLLDGEFRRDPGYPQAVWHLSIPDFWEANTRWARKYPKIADRIGFKKAQMLALKQSRKEASAGDGSKEASAGDRGVSPDDGGISPDDAKKNVLKNQKEEQKDSLLKKIEMHAVSAIPEWRVWNPIKRRLEEDSISITGDGSKITISGLCVRQGQFTEAQVWTARYQKSFANTGLELEFRE